jgi:RNA polymerase sigma-54 factor
MMKQTQSQKQVQKALPQLIQRQNLLAIPTLSVEQLIRQEMEINPFLEDEEFAEEEQVEEKEEEPIVEDSGTEEEIVETDKVELENEFDVDDYLNSETDGYKAEGYETSSKDTNFENIWKTPVTMRDNLFSQLNLAGFSEKEIFIGELIIGYIDSDGYMREETANILNDIENIKKGTEFEDEVFSEKDIHGVLCKIKKFEPTGIASRNLRECLLAQVDTINAEEELKSFCRKILTDYFEELRLKNYEKLLKELSTDIDTLNKIFDLIGKLNPKPGNLIDSSDNHYIVPDLLVIKDNDEYKVELNDRHLPPLRINSAYVKLINGQKKKIDKNTKEFIKNNYERAKWFIDALKSRRLTMLRVMHSILKRQREFFDSDGEHMKPLFEKDVAEDISMDISTVSRTVRGKYVQTDFGIYELKYFFSNNVKSDEGDDISSRELKSKLKDIIQNENPLKPLSDDDLTEELIKLGFRIARRTVAKYRESMKIPKARLRRKL